MKIKLAVVVFGVLLAAAGAVLMTAITITPEGWVPPGGMPIPPKENGTDIPPKEVISVAGDAIETFASEEEFKHYLTKGGAPSYGMVTSFMADGMAREEAVMAPMPATKDMAVGQGIGGGAQAPERISGTNVQVAGIDEPDIVKTDGNRIFASLQNFYFYDRGMPMPMMEELIVPDVGVAAPTSRIMPPQRMAGTKVIKAFPPAEMKEESEIEPNGNLLLHENTLAVFTYNAIFGYDVSDSANPKEIWTVKLHEGNAMVASRLYGGTIYMISQKYINRPKPCPFEPFTTGEKALEVRCVDIYHPRTPVPADITYTVAAIDMKTGEAKDKVSFVGNSSSSVVYMSEGYVYVTYGYGGDTLKFMLGFAKENADLFSSDVIGRMEKLMGYDISDQSKMTELSIILQEFTALFDDRDEMLRLENELANRMERYVKDHKRELEQTGIVKIAVDDLSVRSSGRVPGTLLNQFSLDEYQGNLRVAVTVGSGWGAWGWMLGGFGGTRESANDIYVLNPDMTVIGSVKDMGVEERIYSARFIQDKGYLVTFRQTDPFYVLDLSSPANPQLKGELKIPGYSSYLHPITKDKIVGVGMENSSVKISLFDVADPSNPKEADKYTLSEYWSDVLNTHHAFLLDEKFGVFFMPGGKGGYIFSYKGDTLSLVKAVSDIVAKRALFVNDYLYIVGDDKIVVLNEQNWEKVSELELSRF